MFNTILFTFCLAMFVLLFQPTLLAVQMGYLGFMMRGRAIGKETLISIAVLACELVLLVGVFKFFPFQITWIG